MADPYTSGMFTANPYAQKIPVCGSLCVVLRGTLQERGLVLISQPSRCLRAGEVHELILTDEPGAKPGERVNSIGYLGFFTVTQPGVIVAGDTVQLDGLHGGTLVGTLAGFDETHMPNHQNIVIRVSRLTTGEELGASLGQGIRFGTTS